MTHILAYFSRDMAAREISANILIIEQAPGGLFNRGMVKNVGALLAEKATYFAFHDVDHLPIWADYSPTAEPACIVGFGFKRRFTDNPAQVLLDTQPQTVTMGGVVLLSVDHFRRVNGHSNAYWGWAYEDVDLRNRLLTCGLNLTHRPGTFHVIDHVHEGFKPDGSPTEENVSTRAIYDARWSEGKDNLMAEDGLSSCRFDVLNWQKMQATGLPRELPVDLVTVALQR
jgi:hypothetical protein